MRCLKKRMQERPKSALELEQLLAAIPLEGLPTAYPPGTSRRAPAPPAPAKAPPGPNADAHTLPALVTPKRD
jgi:hypothetical protein